MLPQDPCYISDDSSESECSNKEPRLARALSAEERALYLRDDVDVIQDYVTLTARNDEEHDEDEDNIPYITIDDDEDSSSSNPKQISPEPSPETICHASIQLTWGIIRPGDTVELKDTSGRRPTGLLSGDFLRIKEIVEYLDNQKIKLRGERFRRISYQRPLFDYKLRKGHKGCAVPNLNEVFKLISVNTDDRSPLFEADLQDVVSIRELVVTNAPYPLHSFQETRNALLRGHASMTNAQIKEHIFKRARLVCRFVMKEVHHKNGRTYGAEIRCPYTTECDPLTMQSTPTTSASSLHEDSECFVVNRPMSPSIEVLDHDPFEKHRLPHRPSTFTFGDMFCGAGIGTQGALQAGLKVVWGLDSCELACEAWKKNFPGGIQLTLNAEDFADVADRNSFGVDIIHFSCPCQYWSFAHTNQGKDDVKNSSSIFTPEKIIKRLKPRLVTFEQADGLLRIEKHKFYFRGLLNSLLQLEYKVRYKIEDLCQLGVPQRRKRLLIIAARKDTPLPPFPRPAHGPPGSGLAPYVTIHDALEPLRRFDHRHDERHNPDSRPLVKDASPFDPKTSLVKCSLTCDGGKWNYHPTELRKLTVRELAYFQTCPYGFNLAGPHTDAQRQVGNGFPCKAAEALFLSCAQTLEAHEHDFIDDEEDIDDLWESLDAKGIQILREEPGSSSASRKFRYLNRLVQTPAIRSTHDILSRHLDLGGRDEPRRRSHKRDRGRFFGSNGTNNHDNDDMEVELPTAKKRSRSVREQDDLGFTLEERLWLARERNDYVEIED